MLSRIDRVLISSHDAEATAQQWISLLDAEHARDGDVPELGARRVGQEFIILDRGRRVANGVMPDLNEELVQRYLTV